MGSSFVSRVSHLAIGATLIAGMLAVPVFARDAKTISELQVQEEEGLTRIVLRGAEDPIYTAFMREDPPRLIIELPDVMFDGIETPVRIQNGMVEDVTLAAFGDPRVSPSMARISILLEVESEYELLPNGNELVIELRPMGAVPPRSTVVAQAEPHPAPVPPAASEPQEPEVEEVVEPEPVAPIEEPEAPEVETVELGRILKVHAEGDAIQVTSDGPIDNVDAFQLADPDRLVVDFWGVKNAAAPVSAVPEGAISSVRIGEHPDKVRVVMDLRLPILSHTVEPTGTGVRVWVESDTKVAEEAQSAALPAAPAEEPFDLLAEEGISEPEVIEDVEPEAVPEVEPEAEFVAEAEAMDSEPDPIDVVEPEVVEPPETVELASELAASAEGLEVGSVHFESLPGIDRVVLSVAHPVDPKVVRPNDRTVIVDLPGTHIATDNERRVDTTEFGGPLQMFSVFQTPDVQDEQVRVVLKRQGDSVPSVEWDEGRLVIEFSYDAEMKAEAPAQNGAAEPSMQAAEGGTPPASLAPTAPNTAEAAPASIVPVSLTIPGLGDDPMLAGPAAPASIDILEEGGFNEEKSYIGRRISLDFKDADIANIMRLIAEVSDLNIIAGEEVEGKVTIRLVDVPWDQAMDVILLTKGLGFVRVGNVLRIAPLETLRIEEDRRLQERRAKEKLEDLVVKLQPVNYATVSEVQQLVQRLLSGRGSVNVDERTNTLIIKDIPSVIHEATALVKAIDTQTPQVLIEAKIVEATLNFSRSLGANWGFGFNQSSGSRGGAEDLHLADGTLDAVIPVADDSQLSNFISSNPVLGALNGLMTLGILGLDDKLQLDLQLMAAESNRKGKVISSPRVVTLDNREANIKQGVAIKFTEVTRDTVTTSFVDAVLELKVTPHITADRSIIMAIKVSRNAPQLSEASGSIVGIAKNETETEALVRDGETMVLGGIYVVDNGRSKTKFPFLADIPLLGTAFRSSVIADERRELLIFVTPRIVSSPASDA